MIKISNERLEQFNRAALLAGSHSAAEAGAESCAMEWAAYLAGEEHSDAPTCVDRAIRSAMVRLNDNLNDAQRQSLKPYVLRALNTAGSRDLYIKRGYIAADFAVRRFAPEWYDLAGLHADARILRDLPPLTPDSIDAARALVTSIREKHGHKPWWSWRYAVREKVYAEVYAAVLGALKKKHAAATTATAAADAAADAAATAAADAAADAAIPKYGTDAYWTWRSNLRERVRVAVRARLGEAWGPTARRMLPMALEMLDAMIEAKE